MDPKDKFERSDFLSMTRNTHASHIICLVYSFLDKLVQSSVSAEFRLYQFLLLIRTEELVKQVTIKIAVCVLASKRRARETMSSRARPQLVLTVIALVLIRLTETTYLPRSRFVAEALQTTHPGDTELVCYSRYYYIHPVCRYEINILVD